MNRKNNTIKQLQAECKERKIGFMTNWTKIALIKRLEDEDKREIANKKIEDKASKANKELESIKIELKNSDPKVIEQEIKQKMYDTQVDRVKYLRQRIITLGEDQNAAINRSNKMAKESVEVAKEIKALEFSIANLK